MKLFQRTSFLTLVLCALCLFADVFYATAQEPQVAKNVGEITREIQGTKNDPDRKSQPPVINTNLSRVGVQTAQPLSLSLNDAIRKALEGNNTIEISRDDVRFQETRLRSLLGVYDPIFSVSPTYTKNHTTGQAGTNDFRINSDFAHFIQPGGGNYRVFFNNTRTENAFSQAQVSSGFSDSGSGAIFSSSLGVSYTQPLFRNLRTDSKRQQIKIARKRLQQSDADFRRTTIETIARVQQTYWDLVFALRDQQNRVANVNLAKENLRQIEARIEAGAAAPLERAEVATELANREGDLLLATQQVSITENSLKQLVIKDPASAEWLQTYVPTDKPVIGTDPVSLDVAMKDAMDNRYELRRLKLDKEINDIDLSYYRNQIKPQIDFNTTFSLNGLSRGGANNGFTTNLFTSTGDLRFFDAINELRALHALPLIQNDTIVVPPSSSFLFGGFNRSLANMFRSDAPNYSVGLTISFPFGNKIAKANLAGAKVQQEQISAQTRSQEQVVVVEVRNAVQSLETARQRVLTARTARENAEIQLDGERKLYDAGKSTTFLLFQRENTLTNARNSEIRAETDYNKALSDLQRVTSTTFQVNNIQVESPTDNK
jgi:outer membrane protein TolC